MSERRITISLTYSEFENIKACFEMSKEEISIAMEMLKKREMKNPILRLEAIRQNLGLDVTGEFYYIPHQL